MPTAEEIKKIHLNAQATEGKLYIDDATSRKYVGQANGRLLFVGTASDEVEVNAAGVSKVKKVGTASRTTIEGLDTNKLNVAAYETSKEEEKAFNIAMVIALG